MSVIKIPLPPEELARIEAFVAGIDDEVVQRKLRRKLTETAQAEANSHALDRRRFREAIEFATLNGYADPAAYANARVASQRTLDKHDSRVTAIMKRGSFRSAKRFDRAAVRHEDASKSAKPSRRRMPQRDRQYLEIVGEAEKLGYLGDRALVLSKINSKLTYYRLPHWDHTTLPLKMLAYSIESAKDGAQTINLRPNPKVTEQALRSPRGPAGYMQDRIRREMEKAFGRDNIPDFWFVVETDSDKRFHLHGAVVTPTVVGAPDMVDAALRAAGGTWDAAKGHHHQQISKSLDDPIYWAFYVCKRMNVGKARIDRKLSASTDGVRKRAALGWDDMRATLPQSSR